MKAKPGPVRRAGPNFRPGMDLRFINMLYRSLLGLFPRAFREEFADEMQAVFGEVVLQAAAGGRLPLAKAVLLEIASLPGVALSQRLYPGGSLEANPSSWEGPPTHKESFWALAVFLLPALGLLQKAAPPAWSPGLAILAAVLFIALLLAGVAKGFPRWSLPSLGLAISALSFIFIFQRGADLLSQPVFSRYSLVPLDASARVVLEAAWAGLMWLSLFVVSALVMGLLALFRRVQPLLWRFRQDWTQVSYVFYGGALAALTIGCFLSTSFARQQSEKFFALVSILGLACGAWLYLRSPQPWQRFIALLSGLLLAMTAAAASQWPLIPSQFWPDWALFSAPGGETWAGAHRAFLEWGWLAAAILTPALVKLISRPKLAVR